MEKLPCTAGILCEVGAFPVFLGDEIFKHFQGEHAPGPPPQNLHKGRSLGQNKNASQFVNIFS